MAVQNVKVRPLEKSDIDAIDFIEKSCFTHPWTRESIISDVSNCYSKYFVCEYSEEIIGYIGARLILDEGEITNIAVIEEYRRLGAAKRMLEAFFEYCKSNGAAFVNLEVRKSNEAAIGLYKSFGFIKVGIRKNYYHSPVEDALLYTKFF